MHTCHPVSTEAASRWHLVGLPTFTSRYRVSTFVQRTAMRGGGWLRFSEKVDHPGEYHVSHFKTKTAALNEW